MSLIGRHAGLAFAVVLALLWALARYRAGSGTMTMEHPFPPAAPLQAAAPAVAAKREARTKLSARLIAPPAAAVKARGARLKEKGEALGGRTPDRIDAGTMTAPSSQ